MIFSLIKKKDFCGFSDQLFRINEKNTALSSELIKTIRLISSLFTFITGSEGGKRLFMGKIGTNLKAMEED